MHLDNRISNNTTGLGGKVSEVVWVAPELGVWPTGSPEPVPRAHHAMEAYCQSYRHRTQQQPWSWTLGNDRAIFCAGRGRTPLYKDDRAERGRVTQAGHTRGSLWRQPGQWVLSLRRPELCKACGSYQQLSQTGDLLQQVWSLTPSKDAWDRITHPDWPVWQPDWSQGKECPVTSVGLSMTA